LRKLRTLVAWQHKENSMNANRIASLERKHRDLHVRIEALQAEKAPDKYIQPLKKQKLAIKDEIEAISKKMLKT